MGSKAHTGASIDAEGSARLAISAPGTKRTSIEVTAFACYEDTAANAGNWGAS